MTLLRSGLLAGCSLVVASVAPDGAGGTAAGEGAQGPDGAATSAAGGGSFGAAVGDVCAELGASVHGLVVDPFGDEPTLAQDGGQTPVLQRVLVWDGAAAFAAFDGVEGVRSALDGAWLAIRGAIDVEAGGQKIVLIAPPPGDAHAEAARAGLENTARTLSVEWARLGIRITTILPGSREDAAQLVAYLASPAGDYFSGTAISLR